MIRAADKAIMHDPKIKASIHDTDMMMEIIFLGTSAAVPTQTRNLACMCIQWEGQILMFDVGEGAQMAFAQAGLGWNRDMSIFITHMHGDHCLGLPGMIQTMALQDRTRPLRIFGPPGIDEFVHCNMNLLGFTPPFTLDIKPVQDVVYETKGYLVKSCEADHTIPAFSYLIQEKDRPGRFHPERAISLGVPEGPLWGRLQRGETVRVQDKLIQPSQILDRPRPGCQIGYSGDTRPTGKLERFYTRCNYLVFDSTFADDMAERAKTTGHSTASEAATLARNAQVDHLILTHFSARYTDESAPLTEAREIHPETIAAQDMMNIKIC